MQKFFTFPALAAALALAPFLAAAPASAQSPLSVVMSGLDNPYGLAFGPDGGLYVAEAGTGNSGLGSGPSFVAGNNEQVYFGDTGGVSRLLDGTQTRIIGGLPSVAGAGGAEATGLQGLTFGSDGSLYGAFGFGGYEAQRTQLVSDVLAQTGAGSTNAGDLGQVVRLNTAFNTVTPLSDLVPYETQNYTNNNGPSQPPEANPYALVPVSGGFAVSDGGGNVVLKAPTGGGAPSLLSFLPAQPNPLPFGPPAYQSVPTALATGSKGNLFAGEFTGFPFPPGGADIYSINPTTGASSVFASGFTTITGLAFGTNGDLYVLDDTTNGIATPNPGDAQLFEVNPVTGEKTLLTNLAGGVDYSSLAFFGNALYISDLGTGPGDGSVLRYAPAGGCSRSLHDDLARPAADFGRLDGRRAKEKIAAGFLAKRRKSLPESPSPPLLGAGGSGSLPMHSLSGTPQKARRYA